MLVFPRDMVGGIRWRRPRLMLREVQEIARDAGGRAQVRDLGPALWRAEFSSVPLRLAAADAAMAGFRTLGGGLRSFFLFDPTHRFPASLNSASALVGYTPTVGTIRSDNFALTLNGLPPGLEMQAGDYISIHDANGGRSFHQLASGATADGFGVLPEVEVAPYLRAAVSTGQAVDLSDPMLEMTLEPGTLDDPFENETHRAITFSAVQVIR